MPLADGETDDDLRSRAIRRVFGENPFCALVGVVLLERHDDHVLVGLPWQPDLRNVSGNHHGGAVATLVDIAAAAAVWNGHDFARGGRRLMTLSMSLQYLGAAPDTDLVCTARAPKRGRDVIFTEMTVTAAGGALVADAHATFGIRT